MVKTFQRIEKPVLLGLLIVSVSSSVLLSHGVRAARRPPAPVLLSGIKAPPLTVTSLEGAPITIDFAGGPGDTILYFFAPNSRRSEMNEAAIARVASAVSNRFRVVGLIPETASATAGRGRVFPVYVASSDIRQAYKLQGLPQTLVIDRFGAIRANWVGTFTGPIASEIDAFLGLPLLARSQ